VSEDETSLVLAVHRGRADLGAIQAVARRLGFDPLGIGVIDIGAITNAEQFELTCTATLARLSHFPGSMPEQVKLLPSQRKTRRSFLSITNPVYVGAPMILQSSCVAGDGCRACVTECPVGALTWSGGVVSYDVNTCITCGICVTTCPTGAMRNPSADPTALEAEIVAVVADAAEPIGIRYRCRDSLVPFEAGWYVVEVPCTGMLTVGWLLAPVLLGAAGFDATPCAVGGCGKGLDNRLRATMGDANRAMSALSGDNEMARQLARTSPGPGLLESGSTGRGLAAISSAAGSLSMDFGVAEVGMIEIDPATCTACEMCAQVCPTGALASDVDGAGVHISFDPQGCVACGQCVTTCPEFDQGAITMTRGFQDSEWARARREVRLEPTPVCEICGGPVAPSAMLVRIQEMLGDDASQTMDLIGRRCVNCRGR
jgi:ferredoxin